MTTKARHSWAKDSDKQKTCGSCGTVAIRGGIPCGMSNAIEYHRNGKRVIAERVPECGDWDAGISKPDVIAWARQADEADVAAGNAFLAGEHERAARLIADARVLDPTRAELWDSRMHRIAAGARLAEHRQRPLAEELKDRLGVAGITHNDRGLQQLSLWNHEVRQRHGLEMEK